MSNKRLRANLKKSNMIYNELKRFQGSMNILRKFANDDNIDQAKTPFISKEKHSKEDSTSTAFSITPML